MQDCPDRAGLSRFGSRAVVWFRSGGSNTDFSLKEEYGLIYHDRVHHSFARNDNLVSGRNADAIKRLLLDRWQAGFRVEVVAADRIA